MADSEHFQLRALIKDWQEWSTTADRNEDGWEGGFPQWEALMITADRLLVTPVLSKEEFEMLEFCWRISEEDEVLAEAARAHLDAAWSNLLHLSYSDYPQVRWQAYDVLGDAGRRAEDRLREALGDPDSYCRRRAILSLSKFALPDAGELAERFAYDSDPYTREAAKLLRNSAR